MSDDTTATGADDDTPALGSVSDAFAVLGDETRVAILEALVDARRADPEQRALTFSELRERTGVTDSGRFNYHLGKLRDRFVEETDDGYVLTYAGREVAGAILGGTYETDVELDPVTLADRCPLCDAELAAEFDGGELEVTCGDEHTLMRTTVPPGAAADRSMHELVSLATRTTYARMELLVGGICPECSGRVEREIVAAPDSVHIDYSFQTSCERCGAFTRSSAGVAVLRTQAFIGFCEDHAIDVADQLPWTLPFLSDGETVQTSADPPRYRVRVETDDERLDLTLDERGVVVDTERNII